MLCASWDHFKYLTFGREIGDAGNPHLQGFAYFSTCKSLRQMKVHIDRAHWEAQRGTCDQAINYCHEDSTPENPAVEIGEKPLNQSQKGETEIVRYQRAWESARDGNILDVEAPIRVKYFGTLKRIATEYGEAPKKLKTIENFWYYGAPGLGKSMYCHKKYPDLYPKTPNKWWDCYEGQETVLLDDYDKTCGLSQLLKIWADRYSFIGEVKGGTLRLRPKRILVTSNYTIQEIFGDTVLAQAIARRFTEVCVDADFILANPWTEDAQSEDEAP